MSGLLEIDRLTVRYPMGSRIGARLRRRPPMEVIAIDDLTLGIARGDAIGIVGESGCGKSTLAKAIVGLAPISGGSIRLDGQELAPERHPKTRRRIQMVFQDPGSSLNPSITVRRALAEPLRVHQLVAPDQVEHRCCQLVDLVELPRWALDALPRSLSGGQQQRVAIARALALEPDILIADEAVAALDVSVQAPILHLLATLRDTLGLTMLFISHDLAVVRHVTDRVAVLYLGTVVEDRPTEDLFIDPRHPYTKALMKAAPKLGVHKTPGESALRGEPPSPLSLPTGCRFRTRCPLAQPICAEQEPPLRGPAPTQHAACHFAWT
jgi:oligopeptide/dipeptide ABC transporter ATP-binding protein